MYSTEPLKDITIRILNQHGRTVGAGFLIGAQRVVTCAHVVVAAGRAPGDEIQIEFFNDQRRMPCTISAEHWSDPKEDDVALLLLAEESLPREIPPLRLPQDVDGHCFAALGFPDMGDYKVLHASGHLSRLVPTESQRRPLLQIEGKDIFEGMSGAAVFDTDTGDVVGMISECLPFKSGEKYAYATTAETIRSICPFESKKELEKVLITGDIKRLCYQVTTLAHAPFEPGLIESIKAASDHSKTTGSKIQRALRSNNYYPYEPAIEDALLDIEQSFQKLEGIAVQKVIRASLNDDVSRGDYEQQVIAILNSLHQLLAMIR